MASRIREARNRYIEELKKIKANLDQLLKQGEVVDDKDIMGAIRMTLSEWAKEAKVSALFEGI